MSYFCHEGTKTRSWLKISKLKVLRFLTSAAFGRCTDHTILLLMPSLIKGTLKLIKNPRRRLVNRR